MANYNSIPRRFNRPTSNINHAYINTVLRDKQNTIDTNFGVLQQNVEKILGTDLARQKDKDMLRDRVSAVLNTLEMNDAINFDSKKTRFQIQDALAYAAKDRDVLKQVANTKKLRQVQDFYQKRLEEGDLSQQNFQYAYTKAGIDSYMNGDTDNLGDFQYLEYVDVDEKLNEVARKLKTSSPNEEVSIQNPITGQTVSKKISMVTPDEMRNYLRLQLNANDLKQLEIDGSIMYGMDNATAVGVRDNIISESNRRFNDEISILKNYRDNGNKTKGEVDQINQQIKSLESEKAFFEKNMLGQKTAEAIGGQQLLENKIGFYSDLYTKNGQESVKYDSDYLKRMRDANAQANLPNTSNISTITTPTDLPDEVNPYQDSLNRIDRTLRQNSNYLQTQFDALSEDKKALVQDTMNQIKNDPEFLSIYKGQQLSNEILQLETINRLGPNFFPPDVANGIRTAINSTKAIQDGINTTTSNFVKSQVLQEDVYEQVFVEESALTMVTPQGDINIQQYLKDNGVNDYASYKSFMESDSKEAKKLRSTLALQSMSLTNDITPDDFSLFGDEELTARFNEGTVFGTTRVIDLSESEYRIMRQAVHDITGESLEETYSVSKNNEDYVLSMKNSNTAFAGIVNKTNDLYQKGRISPQDAGSGGITQIFGFRDTDRTARNESVIRDAFSADNYREFASNNLDYLDTTIAGSNSIRIKGNEKKIVDPIYEEVLQYVDNVTFDKKLPIDIYRRDNGELVVTQIVQDETAVNNDEATAKQKIRQGTILANDVPKMALFNDQIDLMQKENTFSNLEALSGTINKMSFIRDNRDQIEGLNRLYDRNNGGENVFRLLSAEKTARDIIFNPNVEQYIRATQEGLMIKSQFEDFVRNTQNYELEFTKGIDSDYQVVIKDIDGNDVGNIPLNNNIPVDVFEKAFQGTPQVFLSMYSKSRVDKYMQSLINGRR